MNMTLGRLEQSFLSALWNQRWYQAFHPERPDWLVGGTSIHGVEPCCVLSDGRLAT